LSELTGYLVCEVERLAKGDADLALIAANTRHIVFDDVRSRSSIPLASIVEATREFARAMACAASACSERVSGIHPR
jgi:aspartate racemase